MEGRVINPFKEFEEFFNRLDSSNYKNTKLKFNYDCINRYTNLLFRHMNAS